MLFLFYEDMKKVIQMPNTFENIQEDNQIAFSIYRTSGKKSRKSLLS
jgi:hypothetical protein